MKSCHSQNVKGFTLIEMLLSIALASVLFFVISAFLVTLEETRIKNRAISEVEDQALFITTVLAQKIRNAESITVPTNGNQGSSLTLSVTPANSSPVVFDLSGGALRIKEGSGTATNLTSSSVVLSNLTFVNVSRSNSPGMVRVGFTLQYMSTSNRFQYIYQKDYSFSSALNFP